jgi:hypothetical protein
MLLRATATPLPPSAPRPDGATPGGATPDDATPASAPGAAPAQPSSTSPQGPTSPQGYGCQAALAYLQSHAAPGYQLVCPGYAEGHEAMTCDNWASICLGQKEIVISDPCPIAYMNEASNSLVFSHLSNARIDPFGYSCSG